MGKMTERAASPDPHANPDLGPLRQLPGIWVGTGFNILCLPVQKPASPPPEFLPFRVKVNATVEELHFSLISSAPIPNRGFIQDDLKFLGLHYTQKIADRHGDGGIHFEQGLWLFAQDPNVQPGSLYRLATVPHGSSFLAVNTEPVSLQLVTGAPVIPDVDPRPFTAGQPSQHVTGSYLNPFFQTVVPHGLNPDTPPSTPPGTLNPQGDIAGAIGNPNLVLKAENADKRFIQHTAFTVQAVGQNVSSMPFLVSNANVTSVTATFWISEFEGFLGLSKLHLQYSQTVILNFAGIDWPHVSVGTLIMPFG
jgi:hypothetical protein